MHPKGNSRSSQLTDEEWTEYVDLFKIWNPRDKSDEQKKMRREKKWGYSVYKKHELKTVTEPSGLVITQKKN